MMKKMLVFFYLLSFSFVRGMENFGLRLKINDIADQHRWDFPPRWVEDQATQIVRDSINNQINRELSELAFPYQSLEENYEKQEHADLDGELESLPMQHTPNYNQQNDYDHCEVDRRLEPLQSQNTYHAYARSSVPNPDRVQGWMYKDDWIFPFVGAPDMSNDPEINRFKQYLETHDAAALHHEIIAQQANLKNRSFIDRVNKYKISRRLSFIIKYVRENPAMHYLLQIHQANRLEDACFGLEQLRFLLNNRESIEINGKQVILNDHKISEIINAARRFIEQKSYYQAEKRKYPETKVGGQLLNKSPILTKIDMMLRKDNSSHTSIASQKSSMDPFTDALTRKVNSIPSVEDQIAALTDLQTKITANPATDFHTYTQEIEQAITSLKNSGKWTVETAELIFKGFVEGAAEHIVHTVKHPIEYIQNNAEFIKQLTLFCADICSQPDEFLYANPQEIALFEERIQHRVDQIAKLYQQLCETIPQMSREDWGRVSGQLFADFGIAKGIGKSLHLAKNMQVSDIIKENPLVGKVRNKLEQALLKHPEMVTAEGVVVKGVHEVATEQSLLQKMSNETQKAKKLNTEVSIGELNTSVQLLENEANYITKTINGKTFLEVQHPVIDSIRTDSALKLDPHHAFDNRIDNFVRYASKFSLEGNDGIVRELYQLEGSLDGISGLFEWILDPRPEKGVTHRLFIKDGTITGKPNIRVKK